MTGCTEERGERRRYGKKWRKRRNIGVNARKQRKKKEGRGQLGVRKISNSREQLEEEN